MRIKELMFKNKVPTKALTIDMKYPPLPTTHIILKKKRVSGLKKNCVIDCKYMVID